MKLWTHDFIRVYMSNLLLYTSLYMLLPVLPMYLVDRFGITLSEAGGISALFAIGLFISGPFYSYLIDSFRRKTICLLAYLAVIAILLGYTVIGSLIWVAILRIMQGSLFGIATTMGSTLAIDITDTSRRSEANTGFCWASKLGMVFGAMIGILIYRFAGLQEVLYASVGAGTFGLGFISLIHVAFRAPIGASLFSLDRFFLPRGWIPALNLILISSVFGLLLSSINMYTETIHMQKITVHFFSLLAGGFILAMIANRFIFEKADLRAKVVSGLLLMSAALLLISTHEQYLALITAAVLMGLGLGLVSSDFLHIFIKLCEHCQRGTANTTYRFAWEVGIALGVVSGCLIIDLFSYISVFHIGLLVVVLSLLFYLFITVPYFKKHKTR